ncbi:restriction endonuclease subunit S [Emticicia sp. TH156]|uniref:restriction endonuclease subunit S n=1 Tax=Emticicia sp. TH156 TaxID=2067454 RepID=UPI000C788A3B|nr:restriction endonuclease subunit S [Emticicia sp. TH156]PLK42118.1 type I restriction endonuclease subunit R [Emticicia sp. TH156]
MNWKKVKLGEICEIFSGFAWSAKDFSPHGHIPIIRIQNIGKNGSEEFVYWDKNYDSKYIIKTNDILLSLSGSIKIDYWKGINGLLNQRIVKITPAKNVEKKWLFWQIGKFIKKIEGMGKLALVNNVSLGDIKNLEIPLPELATQKHIAEVLDKADVLRQQNRQLLTQYDELLQSTFIELFGDPVKNPKGWEVRRLGDICDNIQIGPFGSLLHQEDYISNGIPLINPINIIKQKIVPDFNLTVSEKKFATLKKYHLRKNDIIMGRRGEMGRCALITEKEDGWLCGTGSLFLRPKSNVNSYFLLNILSSSKIKKLLEAEAQGVTMPNLNSKIVNNIPIISPTSNIQYNFAKIVEQIEVQKEQAKKALDESDALFEGLLAKYFN